MTDKYSDDDKQTKDDKTYDPSRRRFLKNTGYGSWRSCRRFVSWWIADQQIHDRKMKQLQKPVQKMRRTFKKPCNFLPVMKTLRYFRRRLNKYFRKMRMGRVQLNWAHPIILTSS